MHVCKSHLTKLQSLNSGNWYFTCWKIARTILSSIFGISTDFFVTTSLVHPVFVARSLVENSDLSSTEHKILPTASGFEVLLDTACHSANRNVEKKPVKSPWFSLNHISHLATVEIRVVRLGSFQNLYLSFAIVEITHGVTANRDDTDFHHAKPQILYI